MIKIGNKRGFELTISTVVIIILFVFVLISLLVFWNYQTGIFSDFIRNIMGKSNVDSLVISCNSLVNQNAVYEYCCEKKQVKLTSEELELTCKELSEKDYGTRIEKLNCDNAGCGKENI